MFKLFKKTRNNFKKKTTTFYTIKQQSGLIFLKKKQIIKKKQMIFIIKKLYRLFKKKHLSLFLFIKTNRVQSFKTKNARMGGGKGQILKKIIHQRCYKLGLFKNFAFTRTKLLWKVFNRFNIFDL